MIYSYLLIFLISALVKRGFVIETSLDLIYILPYFYLVHVIYYIYLMKTNLPIYFYSISQSSL